VKTNYPIIQQRKAGLLTRAVRCLARGLGACVIVGIVGLFALSGLSTLEAQEIDPNLKDPGLSFGLVADVSVIQPGKPFTLGMKLAYKPQWHTYWKSPGDVGIPPQLDLELPKGWQAGPLLCQHPEVVKMFDITAWGHRGSALHLMTITPPASLSDAEVLLKGNGIWMVCGPTCHPNFQPMQIRLPVGEKAVPVPKQVAAFNKIREKQPVVCPAWAMSCHPIEGGEFGLLRLELRPLDLKAVHLVGAGAKDASEVTKAAPYFFCSDAMIRSNAKQKLTRLEPTNRGQGDEVGLGAGFRLDLPVSEFAPENKTFLEGILVRESGWLKDGACRSMLVRVRIETP